MSKTKKQEKKYKQFQLNFESVSLEFKLLLKSYRKRNEKLSFNDMEESDIR